jgi:cobalt-zinc-cadmium resistance protein CzcA
MHTPIPFFLRHRWFVVLAVLALCAGGLLAWFRLPIDAFPDVTNVQVMVLTEAPGQTPVDVEQQVTFPLELSLQGLPGVTQVRSLSKAGLSQVIVVFEDGTDIYFARQVVFERLQAARADLPAWAEPEMGPVSTGLGEVFQWTLESPTRTLMDLRTLQDWVVAPQLRALPGVTEVNTFGGFLKQYQVLVDPDLLLKYGVALREVEEAVARNNASAGGGYLVQGWEQAYVRSAGQAAGTNDLEAIVLKAVDGVPVRLGQVATVAIGHAARQGAVTRDGRGEAVAGMAIMLKGANARTVVDRIRAALPAVAASLPDDVRLNVFYDRITLIRACIRTVGDALLQGGFLVIVVLFLLLGNARAALITAAALPVSALLTFLAMGAAGLAANLMSLGGLAIAVGMLGDASIVVTENVARHMSKRHGSTGAELTAAAVAEVARPILFAGLTVIVVFLPILTLQGMEGRMFRPLAVTVCIALAASLFAAFTLIPALASGFLRPRAETREPRLTGALKRLYRPVLDRALRRPGVTLTASALLIAAAAALAPRVGTEFLPALDEGAIAINIVRLPTAALDGSVEVGTLIERRFLDAFPEIESIVTKTGRAEISEDPMGPEQNDVIIALKPPRTWTPGRTKADLVAAMQEELAKIPGIRPSFSQPIALRVNELISGIKSDVAVKLFGPDLETLRDEANRIAVAIREIEGAEDVKVEQVSGFRQVEIVPDRAELARRGLNAGDVNEMVETAVGGRAVTRIAEGQRRFDAVVRFVADRRGDLDALRRLPLPAPDGSAVPLGEVARIVETEAPAQIGREDGMRRIVVECNVRGRDPGGFAADVERTIAPFVDGLPDGYWARLGGQFENQRAAMRRLSVVVPVALGLIFVMLLAALGTVRHALLVFAVLPFALVGGVLTLVGADIDLSVPAAIGFIALFGIAVGNGVVLVTFMNQLRASGVPLADAVRQACDLRFRPLLMTALTTLLGLVPLVLATGAGAEVQRPLAAVVIGGLATSTLLTLVVLPALYLAVETRVTARPRNG